MESSAPLAPASGWLEGVGHRIRNDEYRIRPDAVGTFETFNRRHGFRADFARDRVGLTATTDGADEHAVHVRTAGWGRTDNVLALRATAPTAGACLPTGEVDAEGQCLRRLEYVRDSITEWWVNRRVGLEQGWTIEHRPSGAGQLIVDLAIEGSEVEISEDGLSARLSGVDEALYYAGLHVFDADGDELEAEMVETEAGLRIRVDDTTATYPVIIDPTYITADWSVDSNLADPSFGWQVASAGDVNGDGYADVIVGAPNATNGESDEGRAFVYHGSSSGLSASAAWVWEPNISGAKFGVDVEGAGDVNGDGFDDVIVGAYGYADQPRDTDEGAAYIFFGSSGGVSTAPDWMVEPNQKSAQYGGSVDGAGDVDGDGIDDVIVGAQGYDNGETAEGAAFIYLGSASGPATTADVILEINQASAAFGAAVSTAGDVDGDGYGDVVVGAPFYDNGQTDEGGAFVFLGSATGVSSAAAWSAESDQAGAEFGDMVSAGGDINGDGYGDVLVGARRYEATVLEEGKAYAYLGSSSGLQASPSWTVVGGQSEAHLGEGLGAAGDVDADGFDDVVVGAHRYANGETFEGHVFIYRGSSTGLPSTADWAAEPNQSDAWLGWSVASAGDVDGDGTDEIIASAIDYDNGTLDEGMVFVYSPQTGSTDADGDGSLAVDDCNDNDASIYPGATEVCDGVDNDCDGSVDEGCDDDADGYCDASMTVSGSPAVCPNSPADTGDDCDDTANATNPGATETCNGVDDDCDGSVDEGVKNTYYADADADGYGNSGSSTQACSTPSGYVADDTDCDDASAATFPGAAADDSPTACMKDADADEWGDVSPPVGVTAGTDCDDSNSSTSPGGTESCNGVDDDCDGSVDEGVKDTYYADADADGYGNSGSSTQACSAPSGYVSNSSDCDDASAATYPGAAPNDSAIACMKDSDNDDWGDGSPPVGVTAGSDCNDSNSNIHPGATETCNGVDDDCDGSVDEGVKNTYYADTDADGYGASANTTQACSLPGGYVTDSSDCDDTDATIHPGATESCNGVDDDCDGSVDEGVKDTFYADSDADTYGDPSSSTQACSAPSGYVSDDTDCDDASSATFPGAAPSDSTSACMRDADGDQWGDSAPGSGVSAGTDCDDATGSTYPGATETCNGVDDDCDGTADEGVEDTFYADSDSDSFGDANRTTLACSAPSGYVSDSSDCDDSDATIHPGATESCNSVDDDCDGSVDEGVENTYYVDSDADTFGDANRTTLACSAPSGYVSDDTDCDDASAATYPGAASNDSTTACMNDDDGDGWGDSAPPSGVSAGSDCDDAIGSIHPGATETCNNTDDDCDGTVDEGVENTYYVDSDADSYGDASSSTQACSAPSGYVSDDTDCDDTSAATYPGAASNDSTTACMNDDDGDGWGDSAPPSGVTAGSDCDDTSGSVHPGAIEECNNIDDDCNGVVDDYSTNTYYADTDGDGFGNAADSTDACSRPTGYVSDDTDCDDAAASVHPGSAPNDSASACMKDADNDDWGDASPPVGVTAGSDCDDARNSVNPDATETCNGLDDDCDGVIDDGVTNTYYADTDGDGYGDTSAPTSACSRPGGYVADSTDCDDTSSAVHPAASEVCNQADDDCDGVIDEGVQDTYYADSDNDGYGDASNSVGACAQPQGYVVDSDDCDDTSSLIYPGIAYNDSATACMRDEDGDGYGDSAPPPGVAIGSDCDDAAVSVYPSAQEVCNGIDDDCDGSVDDGLDVTYFADSDGDGFGDGATSTLACSQPSGHVENDEDCDDSSAAIHPLAAEICDGVDNDCDGSTDTGCNCVNGDTQPCYDGPSGTEGVAQCAGGTQTCSSGQWGTCQGSITPQAELCNGSDDDCDATIDDATTDCASTEICYAGACTPTCASTSDCPTGTQCYPNPNRCVPGPCHGVQCASTEACYQGTCFETCASDADCSNPNDACYDQRCTSDPCDGVQCASTEACYQGTCFETCASDADCSNPNDACYDQRCTSDPCDGVQCASGEACYQGTCFETCTGDADCSDPSDACYDQRCTSDPCDGVQCASGEACYQGTCFETCTGDADCSNPNDACYDQRCASDPCDGVQCASTEACYQGTCFETCSDSADCSNPNDACYDQRCASDPCEGVHCAQGEACYQGTCFETCTDDADCSNPSDACYDQRCASEACDGVQCATNEQCYQGTCFETCSDSGDCTDPSHACYEERCASSPCDQVQCGSEEICFEGDCFDSCKNDWECEDPADSCIDSRCAQNACEGVTCADRQTCYGGSCFAECRDDGTCPPGTMCYEGRCTDESCSRVMCMDAETCYRGVCFDSCTTDADCAETSRCIAGGCVGEDSPYYEAPETGDDAGHGDIGGGDIGVGDAGITNTTPAQGCSCRTADSGPSGSIVLAWIVLLGAGWIRRRRVI